MKRAASPWRMALCALALSLPPALHAESTPLPRIEQRIGAQLPLQEVLIDDNGQARPLAQLMGGKPALLVPGYYRCPNVCSTLFQGVMEALATSDIPAGRYRLLAVSIDPQDDAASAASKKAAWLPLLGRDVEAHFLSGSAPATARLLHAAGWQYRYDSDSQQYVHPAGMMVLTPDGHISRYFSGLRFDPAEVRQALQQASTGQRASLAEQLWMLCGHEGVLSGRHSDAAMNVVRAGSVLVLLLGLGWLWRQHLRKGRPT